MYLALGDKERAIDEMERAYRERAGNDLVYIKIDPMLDELRGDPRFEKIVASLAPKDAATAREVKVGQGKRFCFAGGHRE